MKIVVNGPDGEVAKPTSKVPIAEPYACIQKDSSASEAADERSIEVETIAPELPPPVLVS